MDGARELQRPSHGAQRDEKGLARRWMVVLETWLIEVLRNAAHRGHDSTMRFFVLASILSVAGCASPADSEVAADSSPLDAAVDARPDTARRDTSVADATEDGADSPCACVSTTKESYYRKGAMLDSGSYLGYYVSALEVGPKLRPGRYTIYAPPNAPEPPFIHTVELRAEDGTVLATHDYHWGTDVSYLSAYTFAFGEYVSISLMCRDGCSLSLWGIPTAFDGKHPLIADCCPE